jgi:hypothetical protein
MAHAGILEILFVLLFGSITDEFPPDALSVIDAEKGLVSLGQETGDDHLAKLIAVSSETAPAVEPAKLDKAGEAAIQNLASRNEKVREKAREDLVGQGIEALPRLRQIVETDARRADETKKVIAILEGKIEAGKQNQALIQQFAIRIAAKRGLTKLVPEIRDAAANGSSFFVRLAAEDALATLDKTYEAKLDLSVPSGVEELGSLPEKTQLIGQLYIGSPKLGKVYAWTMERLVEEMTKQFSGLGGGPQESDLEEGRQAIIGFVRQHGNFRITQAAVIHCGKLSERSGGLAFILRGNYERSLLEANLRTNTAFWTLSENSGFTVFNSPILRLVLLSDHSVLLLPQIASGTFPVSEYLGNLTAKKQALANKEEWKGFFSALGDGTPIRTQLVPDDDFTSEMFAELQRELPPDAFEAVKGMEKVAGTATPVGDDSMLVRFESRFAKSDQAKAFGDFLTGAIAQGVAEIEREMEQMKEFLGSIPPMITTVLEMMKGIQISPDGPNMVLRVTVKGMSIGALFGTLGVRSSVEVVK